MADMTFKLHVRMEMVLELKAPTLAQAIERVAPQLQVMVDHPLTSTSIPGIISATTRMPHPIEVHVDTVTPNTEAN